MDCAENPNEAENYKPSVVIKPISKRTIHQICSGQVVLSLAIAVKELVENAIDAGANNISVVFREHGTEAIEVSDNGSGVEKHNFEALAMKHCTSKIREFSDLESINTLGFRGEALSSLCALSKITIMTRHASCNHGYKIQYDTNGKIKDEQVCARDTGTTVILKDLFYSLPVRRKEFEKNASREFTKMCGMLHAYCLVAKHVKFSCVNHSKQKVNPICSTMGTNSLRDNIISLFGAKEINNLISITEMEQPDNATFEEFNILPTDAIDFGIECYISSVKHDCGRKAPDRQYFYINSRPCEPKKLIKLVNTIYKQFNGQKSPFVYCNIAVKNSTVDVNVTPDKRQIFLEKEKLLLACIKSTLLKAFKDVPSTYTMQNVDLNLSTDSDCDRTSLSIFSRSINNKKSKTLFDIKDFQLKKRKIDGDDDELDKDSNLNKKIFKQIRIDEFGSKVENKRDDDSYCDNSTKADATNHEQNDAVTEDKAIEIMQELSNTINDSENVSKNDMPYTKTSKSPVEYDEEFIPCKLATPRKHDDNSYCENSFNIDTVDNAIKIVQELSNKIGVEQTSNGNAKNNTIISSKTSNQTEESPVQYVEEFIACKLTTPRKSIPAPSSSSAKKVKNISYDLDVTIDDIRSSIASKVQAEHSKTTSLYFRSPIEPASNNIAEKELQKQISKDMFKKMKIIGQFNYAFIIALLDNDLFIIDQHASDEIYNFEELQRTTIVDSQVLVHPKYLHLTAANENVLIENLDVFTKNGFAFHIDHDAEATQKIKLSKVPCSKNYIFGKDDIDEMLFLLQEGGDHNCRPSRLRGMFASRACRKSVMVGHALSRNDMRRLVDHMAEIEKPWNCPHGRPTMRHLANLNLYSEV